MKQSMYLLHVPSGDLYPWNKDLADRPDMVPLDIPATMRVTKDGQEYAVITTRSARDGRPITLVPENPELLAVLDGAMLFIYSSSGGRPTLEHYAKFGLTL